MIQSLPKSLVGVAWLLLPLLAAADSGESGIICSPSDPKDCYPRVFQPTEVFQKIREGQDIPPNLHVRLNIYTGEKEARLNIPMEGDEVPAEEVSTDQAMVIVDQPELEAEIEAEIPTPRDQIPLNAPIYESAGKIVPPPPGGEEMTTFTKAMTMIQMDTRLFDHALDDLVELSHDIYYGVEIMKDGPVLEKLICLLLGSGTERREAKDKDRDYKAANILASSLQNNPTALKEVGDFWKLIVNPICGADLLEGESKTRKDFVSRLRDKLGKERDPATLKAKVTAISRLLKLPKFQEAFLEKKGMELLLAIFLKKGEKWDSVKEKVGQLVMDNFLDEGMGATTGVWPAVPVTDDKICQKRGKMLQDGCWEYHVEIYGRESGGVSWAEDFLVALKEQRPGTSSREKEL